MKAIKTAAKQQLKQQGFNLVELLLTLIIASFLMGYALPSYQRMIEQQTQRSELARLQAVLNHARLMATMNNKKLQVCASSNGQQCDASAFLSGNLLIITDDNQQVVHFSVGNGYPIVFNSPTIGINPLPKQSLGGTLLPCTGFSRIEPKGVTVSAVSRVRVNDKISATLKALCPN